MTESRSTTDTGHSLTLWDVIDWDATARLAEDPTPIGRLAYEVIGSPDPDTTFARFAREYITGAPNHHESRRLRVTKLAAAFDADRRKLSKFLRAKIGPRD